jgi:hypothetical protein
MCETYTTSDKTLATCHHKNMHCNKRLKQRKHFKHILATYVWNMCNIQIRTLAICVWKKWNILNNTSEILTTCLWNTCNMCNIPDLLLQYPYEIIVTYLWKLAICVDLFLQHPYETIATYSETSKTLKTYACNMHFHHNISLLKSCITVATSSFMCFFLNTQKSSVVHVYIRAQNFSFALGP